MALDRREFLKRAGLTAGALSLSGLMGRTAHAAEGMDRYYLHIYFEGGWDMLLGLDPRELADFPERMAPETQITPAYDRLPAQFSRELLDVSGIKLGPCVGELPQVMDQLAIVRGINMGTLTHEVGRRHFITGKAPSGLAARGSAVPTLAAAQIGAQTEVPHLTHRVESYNVDQPAFAAALPVAAVGHLQYILQRSLGIPDGVPANVKGALGAYWDKQRDCRAESGVSASRLADIYRDNRARARSVVESTLYRQFQFDGPDTAVARAHYGISANNLENPFGRAALAAQAIKSGLSRTVSVVLADGLDTHDGGWAQDQSTRLAQGFTALSRLISDLATSEAPGGGSFLDKTTVVVFSEFARTPRLNERNGRDHHLANTAILAGGGIKGGTVIGATSDVGMGPLPIDLATGQYQEGGVTMSPEMVLTTALTAGGFDASSLRSEPIPALLQG